MSECRTMPGDRHPLAPLVGAGVTAGTLAVAFGLLALNVDAFWVAFVVGFGGVLPVSLAALEYDEDRQARPTGRERADSESALDDLRRRYARGDLTDAEFERQLERLLETER